MMDVSSTLEMPAIPSMTSMLKPRDIRYTTNLVTTAFLSSAVVLWIQPGSEAFPADTTKTNIPAMSAGQILDKDRSDLEVISRIRKLGTCKPEWLNPNSKAPSARAIQDAEVFSKVLFGGDNLKIPHVSPAEDGEVNFWWEDPTGMVDLGFYGNGKYSYYARLSNGAEFIQDAVPITQSLPFELLNLLRNC
jgi:hypothetical protein